jgi:hypothetical protein
VSLRCIRDIDQDDVETQTRCVAIFGKRAPGYATEEGRTHTPFGRSKRCRGGHLQGEIRW